MLKTENHWLMYIWDGNYGTINCLLSAIGKPCDEIKRDQSSILCNDFFTLVILNNVDDMLHLLYIYTSHWVYLQS